MEPTVNKRIGILTGGGDVPGLNVCLKALVNRSIDLGLEPIGLRKGWEGLINYDVTDPATYSENFIELTRNRVRAIDQSPGSFLHSSRLDPRSTPAAMLPRFLKREDGLPRDLTKQVVNAIAHLDLHALVVLGDDDMLRYAAFLSEQGVPIVAIPKTIHNNIGGTDYTLGFSTGLARGVHFIHELRALAGSREQIIVVETFGNHSGFSALLIAYLGGVDRVLIPEVPYDPELLAYLVTQDRNSTPSNYAIVTVSNGARVAEEKLAALAQHLPASEIVEAQRAESRDGATPLTSSGLIAAELLQSLTGDEVFFQQLTYLMRTGAPDGQDLLGATNFAIMAAQLVHAGEFGRMTSFQRERTWTHVDLATAVAEPKMIDVAAWYDSERYKPKDGLIWAASAA
jgi:6-phosphofructokinase